MSHFYFDPPNPLRKEPSTLRRLLVRCPSTAKLVETGQTIEEPLWASTPTSTGQFTCPHCAKLHSWTKKDVILAR